MRMLLIITIIFVAALLGCDKSDKDTPPLIDKPLSSVWVTEHNFVTADLSNVVLNTTSKVTFSFSTSGICQCDFLASGDGGFGNYTLSSCSYLGGGNGADPGCASLDGAGIYMRKPSLLKICKHAERCSDYY